MSHVRILAYHAIRDTPPRTPSNPYTVRPQIFREHLRVLRAAQFNFITGSHFADALAGVASLPSRPVLITFDDGYADLLHTVGPILAEMEIPAVAFIVTGRVGQESSWASNAADARYSLCDSAELGELARYGIELGSHSRSHPYLTRILPGDVVEEVTGSRSDLEALGLPRPRLFAFPYGNHDVRVRDAVRNAGYEAGLTTHPGVMHLTDDPFQVPRLLVLSHYEGLRFRVWVELGARVANLRWSPARRAIAAAWGLTSARQRSAGRHPTG